LPTTDVALERSDVFNTSSIETLRSSKEPPNMTVRYGKFEMPENIVHEVDKKKPTYGRFVAGPFERGFGHTVGNSLRRVLLTALEAPAIVSVYIEGIAHEYMAVEGIVEDMTNIVLNFKGALLRRLAVQNDPDSRQPRVVTSEIDITQAMLDAGKGSVSVTIGDLVTTGPFEVINPELHLFTVTKPMKKRVNLRVAVGRGYVPSERHEVEDRIVDEILVDSAFSPVRLVNYFVERRRVGQDTDFDQLVLEVTTDGRITPVEALSFASQIGIKHLQVFDKILEHELTFEEETGEGDDDHDDLMEKMALRIDEIELSVRSTNCLSGADISTIAELVTIPERRLLEFRNFGRKSLREIQDKLLEMGLTLGMDLTAYGITEENVAEKVAEYLEEKKARLNGLVEGAAQ
jgi:DNA-directed RNA polymerase subunit alpha